MDYSGNHRQEEGDFNNYDDHHAQNGAHHQHQHDQNGFAVETVQQVLAEQQFQQQQYDLHQQDNHHQNNHQQQYPHQSNGAGARFSQQSYDGQVLGDDEMNLPEEQSFEERENNENFNRLRDQQRAPGVGFMRKLNSSAYGKKANGLQQKVDLLFDTLDEKALLQNEFKSLAQYERKAHNISPMIQAVDAHPVILVKWNPHQQRFELNEEAVRVLQEANARKNAKVSFVSIVGPKESGKSFLLNQLLETNTTNSKFLNSEQYENSLIMWSQPIYEAATDCEVYFLDIQSEWQETDPLREKLFFFQCILSTVLIYNVRSDKLKNSDFSELRPLLNMQNHFEFDRLELKEDLKYLMPKLHVVMRDFTHEINRQGHTVSGHQYLEEFLFDDTQLATTSEQELKIRRRFIKYFSDRDLTTMVCPISLNSTGAVKTMSKLQQSNFNHNSNQPISEQQRTKLANLNWINPEELDSIFKLEVASLRKRIMAKSDVRSIRGLRFSKSMVIQYIQNFLEDTNAKEKFDFEKAIQILLENEFISVYHDCIDLYKREMTEQFGNTDFMSLEHMNSSLRKSREQVYYNFFQLKAHDIDQAEQLFLKYHDLLKKFISEMEAQFHQINNEETNRVVSELIQEKLAIVRQKTSNGYFKNEDIEFIKNEFEAILNQVKHMCIGNSSDYGETYSTFVTSIQKLMMDTILREIAKSRSTYSEEIDSLKKEKESLKRQYEAIVADNNEQKKVNEQMQKKKDEAAVELSKTQKQEAEVSATLARHKADIENIKWLTSRYQKALSDKSC